ncbi:MAG: tyrosine-protein phosphatase, partial [Planctomycetaceae bacterium]
VLLKTLAWRSGGLGLLLFWPALSCGLLSVAYAGWGPRVFSKRTDGTLPLSTTLLHFPYLGASWLLWHIDRIIRRETARHELLPGIWIGRRLLSSELPPEFDHVVDLTCEFSEPHSIRSRRHYRHFPILDGAEVSGPDLLELAREIAQYHTPVYIHCAGGKGRTGMVAAAIVLVLGKAATAAEAITFAESQRPLISLTRKQQRAVERVLYCLRWEQGDDPEYDESFELGPNSGTDSDTGLNPAPK